MNKRLVFTASAVALAGGFAFLLPRAAPSARPQAVLSTVAGVPPDSYAPRRSFDGFGSRMRAPRSGVVVYVAGEVARAGVYRLPASARVEDALRSAGGATSAGDLVAVNLAETLEDGQEVVVPARGASNDAAPTGNSSGPGPAAHRRAPRGSHSTHRKRRKRSHRRSGNAMRSATISDLSPSSPVDVNLAGASELESLPGIGPSLADRIIAYRAINGPFSSLDDLLDVNGLTDSRLQDIAPYIVVRK